ncbi:cyclin-like protein, partial [Ramicandelaber brevisporus]
LNCPHCQNNDLHTDDKTGAVICRSCGAVVDEDNIISEITFGETAAGAAIVQGGTVNAETGRLISGGGGGGGRPGMRGGTSDSRENTLYRARRRIMAMATALRMNSVQVDSAMRMYTLALDRNFTKGRNAQHVAAACLYIVCRMQKTSHMLIDFSDILRASVFAIGTVFVELVRALQLRIDFVDPSLYVSRFASQLEFGDKTQRVANDALQIVKRMKRDFMVQGRRPAGLCAAALHVASKIHGFHRSIQEIMKVAKIGQSTIRRRLDELKQLKSAGLSLGEFRGRNFDVDDPNDETHNPPRFTQNKLREEKERLRREEQGDQGEADGMDDLVELLDEIDETDTPEDNEDAFQYLEEIELQNVDLDGQVAQDEAIIMPTGTKRKKRVALYRGKRVLLDGFDEQDVSTWTDVDDDEVSLMLLNKEEVERKEKIWMEENGAFMAELELKMKAKEEARKADEEAAAANGGKLPRKRRTGGGNRKNSSGDGIIEHGSAMEAASAMMNAKKFSRKINYDMIRSSLD